MIVLILLALLAAIPIMMQLAATNDKNSRFQLNYTAQANNMAEAGLLDAINWFSRQNTQPVSSLTEGLAYPDAAFQPVSSTDTTLSDTADANIGIVEQYPIDSRGFLWGRYEVHKATENVGYPADPNSVHDITDQRIPGQAAGSGTVWYLESTGYVFQNYNSSAPFNQAPNRVIASAKAATEVRRVSLLLPDKAAVTVNNLGNGGSPGVALANNGRVVGGNYAAVAYFSGNTSGLSGSSLATGTPVTQSVYTSSVPVLNPYNIFGLSASEFGQLADYSVTSAAQLPSSYPAQALVYINGNAVFTSSGSLTGGGILYVNGNLTVNSSASALFSGVVYVSGNVVIDGPATIAGALIANGTVRLNGSGDAVNVEYNDGIVNETRQQVAQYRQSRSQYYTFTGTSGIK